MQNNTVRQLGGGVALGALVVLALVVFGFSTLNIWNLSYTVFNGDEVRAFFNVMLYDFGMLVWMLAFFFLCHSLAQYVIALTAFVVNVLAVFVLNVLSINVTQTLAQVDMASMGQWSVYVIEFIVIWHLAMSLAHIMAHPWVWSQIERGIKHAEVLAKANEKAGKLIDDKADELSEEVAGGIYRQAVMEIRGNGGGRLSDKPSVKQLTATVQSEPTPVYQRSTNGHGANGSGVNFTNPPNS